MIKYTLKEDFEELNELELYDVEGAISPTFVAASAYVGKAAISAAVSASVIVTFD